MAFESWLLKVKAAISAGAGESNKVGILAFEIARLMSKLMHHWQALSDKNVAWMRHEAIALEGVRKIVSDDDSFLLALACAEISESLRLVAGSVARIGKRCDDSALRYFDRLFGEFADSGKDVHGWVMNRKEMELKAMKKMARFVAAAARLQKGMSEAAETEQSVKKLLSSTESGSPARGKKVSDLQQKLFSQRQEVRQLRDNSLWNRGFDSVVLLLARSVFTVLARVKLVFGLGQHVAPVTLPRSLSATVYPSDSSTPSRKFASGPLIGGGGGGEFLVSNANLLKPPASTVGSAALALHYANLVMVMEKMIRSPHLVGADARDDLYGILPTSLRASLRRRLRGVGPRASDPALAAEWREAVVRILEWLAPLAHNMVKWQNERSFEQQSVARGGTNVLLLQTLFFANQSKTEAAITELLVGLNYIWRFEREMNAMALLACAELNGFLMDSKS